MPYDSIISRDASNDPLVPIDVSDQIIQEMPNQSVMLQRAMQRRLSTATSRQPVLDVLPTAYFVSGDTGMKQTSAQDWKNVELVVEELAVIVPIPEAYLDDSQVPIWDEVRPRITAAFGAKVDAACLFGTSKPSTWGTAIYPGAVAVGNTVTAGTGDDLAVDIASTGELLATQGFPITGFASRPGFMWRLNAMRSHGQTQVPIYEPNLQGGPGGSLYGYPLNEVSNGSWDASEAELIMGDWSKAILGVRQDITFKMFTEGVVTDSDGTVVLNLMQQDAVALRATMRLAYASANPVTMLESDSGARFPFAALQAAGAS